MATAFVYPGQGAQAIGMGADFWTPPWLKGQRGLWFRSGEDHGRRAGGVASGNVDLSARAVFAQRSRFGGP